MLFGASHTAFRQKVFTHSNSREAHLTSNIDNRGRVGGGYMPAGLGLSLLLPSSTKMMFLDWLKPKMRGRKTKQEGRRARGASPGRLPSGRGGDTGEVKEGQWVF